MDNEKTNAKKIVLAVDDIAMNLFVLRSALFEYFDVRMAKSAELALTILNEVHVDLVLLDIEMPGMSGFEFIDAARSFPDAKDVPVICVTSHSNVDIVSEAISRGVKDYIVKPVDPVMLRNKVFAVLNMQIPE